MAERTQVYRQVAQRASRDDAELAKRALRGTDGFDRHYSRMTRLGVAIDAAGSSLLFRAISILPYSRRIDQSLIADVEQQLKEE